MLQEQFAFSYPYEKSSERKLKFTVTELKKRAYEIAVDGGREELEGQGDLLYEEPEVVPLLPKFMQQEEGLTGAPRGTAYHRVIFPVCRSRGNNGSPDGWRNRSEEEG